MKGFSKRVKNSIYIGRIWAYLTEIIPTFSFLEQSRFSIDHYRQKCHQYDLSPNFFRKIDVNNWPITGLGFSPEINLI